MLTVINPDGSCYREFTHEVDSAFMMGDTTGKKNPFPVKIDSTWEINWKFGDSRASTDFPLRKRVYDSLQTVSANCGKDSLQSKTGNPPFTVTIRQNYRSVEDMAARFRLKESNNWSKIKVKYELDKKFRWFYTFYTYRETYPKIETSFELPIEKYMSKDEARFWFTGQPNMLQGMNGVEVRQYVGDLEDKYNKWFVQNYWNAEYKVLLANYDRMSKKPVSRERLAQLRDSIFEGISISETGPSMKKELNQYFKTNAFDQLWDSEKSPLREFESNFSDMEFLNLFAESFTYRLKMPGSILKANNAVINGDILKWQLTAYRMVYEAYTIEAQSRKANLWAFVLTGILIIVAVGSFLYKPKVKR
jgi:hypothetical protein